MNHSPWPSSCPNALLTDACLIYDDDATGEKLLDFFDSHPSVISLVNDLKAYRKPLLSVQAIASRRSCEDICREGWSAKSETIALAWKEKGNTLFRLRKLEEALKCYNLMICSATDPQTRFTGISNKAACFYALEKHIAAMTLDTYCLEHELDMVEARKTKLSERIKKCEFSIHMARMETQFTTEIIEAAPEYPLVKVTSSQEGGRGIVAAYSIQLGESVFGAPVAPYAASLNEDRISQLCYTCFVSLDTYPILPCNGCGEGFCSKTCFDAASYHQFECKCEWNRSAPEMARLGLYLTLKARDDPNSPYDPKNSNSFYFAHPGPADSRSMSEIYGNEVSIIQSLFTNESKLPFLSVLIHHMFDAILLSKLLSPLKLDRLALLHNILRVNSNAFQIVHLIDEIGDEPGQVVGTQIIGVGFAIYGLPSLLNHSCTPNTALTYDPQSNKLVLRAIEPIAAGQAVYHCYGPLKYDTPVKERHRQLKKRFYFDCRCPACKAELSKPPVPFANEKSVNSFLVSEASTRSDVPLVERIRRILLEDEREARQFQLADEAVQAREIEPETFIARALAFIKARAAKYELLQQLYNGSDKEEIFDLASGLIPTMPKVQELQGEISETFDKIGQCISSDDGDLLEATQWVERSIQVLLRWYPLYSREIAAEYEKMVSIFMSFVMQSPNGDMITLFAKAEKTAERALHIANIVFGPSHQTAKTLKRNLHLLRIQRCV